MLITACLWPAVNVGNMLRRSQANVLAEKGTQDILIRYLLFNQDLWFSSHH